MEQDVEIILLATKILCQLGIENTVLQINNIGNTDTRQLYQEKLSQYFTSYKSQLSKISLNRLEVNPLRILDSKEEMDFEIINKAPMITEYLSKEEKNNYSNLLSHLDALNISYEENGRLVRGLDYYNSTTFEISTISSRSQNALLGGGRYDYLVESMGGPSTPQLVLQQGLKDLYLNQI